MGAGPSQNATASGPVPLRVIEGCGDMADPVDRARACHPSRPGCHHDTVSDEEDRAEPVEGLLTEIAAWR